MKLFVANISRECTEEELNAEFSAFGESKSLKIIKDRDTGQSRGFGFVEMASREAGEKAMQELNEKEIHGRAIVVNEAREQQSRSGGGGGHRGGHRGGGRY